MGGISVPSTADGRQSGTDRLSCDVGGTTAVACSDLYTVGRTLAVLTFEFSGFQGRYQFTLPEDQPLLAQYPSYARLLRRATHRDPARRFQSAGEMAEQLTGVLREVLSLDDGQPRPSFSGLFSPELRAIGTEPGPGDRGRRDASSPCPRRRAPR